MGFRFSSFVAGAAENLTETLKEDEKQAAAAASFGVKALKEQYDKVQAENRKLADDLSKKVKFLEQSDPTATQAQLFAAATNDVYMSAVMEAAKTNPGSFRVADVVKIKEGNESQGTAMDMIKAYTAIPEISQAARRAEGVAVPEKPQGLFGIGTLRNRASAAAGSRAEEQTAKAMGVSIEQLRAASGYKRPEIKTGAEFDYTSLQKQPDSVEDMVKVANVQRVQAREKYGENSEQYKTANALYKSRSEEIVKADKKIEDRRDRLEIERENNKGNPAVVAALSKEIDGLNNTIRLRREATSTNSERQGKGDDKIKYSNAKMRMEDYMNTDMVMNKGLEWRQYAEDKVVFDKQTNTNIVIPGKKANLTPEQEQEYITGITSARMQGLKDLGLVTEKGEPINDEVKALMVAFKLNRPVAPSTQAKAPTQATPAAIPTAQPASNKMPAPKTQAEYDAIPPNTEYMDTDGKVKRKGGK